MQNQKNGLQITDHFSIVSKLLDALGVSVIGMLVYGFYHNDYIIPEHYRLAFVFTTLLVFIIFPSFNLYFSWRGKSKLSRTINVFYAWGLVLSILVIISFFMKNSAAYSRVWFFSWSIVSALYLVLYRVLLDIILSNLRQKGINRKKIIVYGAGQVALDVAQRLKDNYEAGFDIHSFVDDNVNLHGQSINGIPVSSPDKLMSLLEEAQELWIALPLRAEDRVLEILFMTRHLTSVVRYIPDIYNFRLLNHSITEIANIPIIEINGTPLSANSITLKRFEDIIFASLILVLISPLMLIIAIIIKLTSKGPAIYKQERHGWNGSTIKVYKFRSMSVCENKDEFIQATKNDTRITPIGKFIRKTSIDELPQFLNVLQGRMSVVGPRPHAVSMNHDYKDKVANYMQRHKVKPGITGWAQVNGFRGETDTLDKMENRVEYDLFYIQNWSLWFDVKIIFLTVFKGFIGKNAY